MKGSQNNVQGHIISAYQALVKMVTSEVKDYAKALSSLQRVREGAEETAFNALINYQDTTGKTLIHHMIENPKDGERPGIWAMIELRLKGANLNIQDNLGNTALHTCANLYKYIINTPLALASGPVMLFRTSAQNGLIPSREARNPGDSGRIMLALMADVGAMLLCGADPSIKNQRGETIFEMMASLAPGISPEHIKPNICEASCKKAFLGFFDYFHNTKGQKGQRDDFKAEYSWAPNVVGWVEGLNLPASVGNVSLIEKPNGHSSEEDDCCIPSPKSANHAATVIAATASNGGGCTLF